MKYIILLLVSFNLSAQKVVTIAKTDTMILLTQEENNHQTLTVIEKLFNSPYKHRVAKYIVKELIPFAKDSMRIDLGNTQFVKYNARTGRGEIGELQKEGLIIKTF